jgi:hypothetical protein
MEDVVVVAALARGEHAEDLVERVRGDGETRPVFVWLKESTAQGSAWPDESDSLDSRWSPKDRVEFVTALAAFQDAVLAVGKGAGPTPVVEEAPGVYALRSRHGDPVAVAAAAFAEALREQAGVAALDADSAAALGRRAADAVASGLEWYEHVGEVVDVYGAQALLGVGSRQAVYDLVKRHRLLGLRRSGGAMAIPLFQLDPATGRPYRVLPDVLTTFAEAAVDAYTVASWFNTPQLELSGDTPAMALRDPARSDAVRRCAAAAAARWSH